LLQGLRKTLFCFVPCQGPNFGGLRHWSGSTFSRAGDVQEGFSSIDMFTAREVLSSIPSTLHRLGGLLEVFPAYYLSLGGLSSDGLQQHRTFHRKTPDMVQRALNRDLR
jgi:hypothetical protein